MIAVMRVAFYTGKLEGGLLEALGKLLSVGTKLYVFPMRAEVLREHGIEVRAVDVLVSEVDCTLEEPPDQPAFDARAAHDWRGQPAVRLGLNRVRGLSSQGARRLVQARQARQQALEPEGFAFDTVEDLARADA